MKVGTFWALGALAVGGFAMGIIGYGVGQGAGDSSTGNIPVASIGDPANGGKLFVSQGCSMCHQFEGQGGTDAPPLDFMTGNLTATDIALMTGRIWNHVPAMTAAFKAEGIPFPTFQGNAMPDLVAYLHGGGPPPDVQAPGPMTMSKGG